MRGFIVLAFVAVLGLPTVFPALAQAGIEPENFGQLDVAPVDLSEFPTIKTVVTAPEGFTGRRLRASDFTITEDGAERTSRVVRRPTGELEVVLLIDTSGSMREAMEAARQAAVGFVDGLPGGIHVAVLGFGTETTVAAEFSTDKEQIIAAIEGLQASGETALYDAIDVALDQFDDAADTRRSIVLLSDGGDTASSTPIEKVRDRLQDAGTVLHAVELRTPESDPEALHALTVAAGGRVAAADSPAELAAVYTQIASLLVNQYLVTFEAQGAGPTALAFSVQVDGETAYAEQEIDLPAPAVPADGDPRLQIASIDTNAFPDVELRVVAPRPLSGHELDTGSFSVIEDGVERVIESRRITSLDQEVVLVIDTSGSMAGAPLEAAKAAAISFIETMPDGVHVAIHAFGDSPRVVVDFTTDVDALTGAIKDLEASGETALYDATLAVIDAFAARRPSARSVVLLSDGGDTVSTATRDTAVRRLAATDLALFVVELETLESDRAALEELVAPSDGLVTGVEDPRSLAATYEAVARDIGNQYVIRYRSEGAGSSALRVQVDAGGVTAEAARALDLPPAPAADRFLVSRTTLIMGAALWYVAMALIILTILSPGDRAAQFLPGAAGRNKKGKETTLGELAARASTAAGRTLQRRGYERGLNAALERAGIDLRPGEVLVLIVCAALAGFAIGMVVNGIVGGLLLATAVLIASRLLISLKISRRQARFSSQLGETLQLLAGSLRAGYSLMQAIDAVAREAQAPSSEEFRRLVVETRLGRELIDALRAMEARVQSEDFGWVLQAIEIHRDVGGDLADVLDTTAATIRERDQIRRQVKGLSAEGRLSAYVLMALPFGVGFVISIVNPAYLRELTHGGALGWGLLGVAGLLMAGGALWLRKICKIVY